MISAFTPPGVSVVALRSGFGIVAGQSYLVTGMVVNRHWRTGEPDPHVLLAGFNMRGEIGPIGFPRDGFIIPDLVKPLARELVGAGV